MRFRASLFFFCGLWLTVWVTPLLAGTAPKAHPSKVIYGYLEHATLADKNVTLPAKLDTGANSASLYAKHIRYVDINGKLFLHFMVPTSTGDVPFTCAYVGDVNIKARSGEVAGMKIQKPSIKRPFVNMRVQLGAETRTIRVNLANRRRFAYPLLLGREALIAFNGLVDASQTFAITGEA
jgi:hypothetical protein